MLKQLFEYVQRLVLLAHETKQNRDDIEELQDMGMTGSLFVIDLERPEQQAFYPVDQESEKRFVKDTADLQKRIVEFLTPSPQQ